MGAQGYITGERGLLMGPSPARPEVSREASSQLGMPMGGEGLGT